MNYSKNKQLIKHAMYLGCKTAADFSQFLKARAKLQQGVRP